MDHSYPNSLFTGDGKSFSGEGLTPPTPDTWKYPLVRATDAALPESFVNINFDCADPTVLNKKQIQGKFLVCTWDGVPSFTSQPGTLNRVAAQTMGAVGVVLVMMQDYDEPNSPLNFDFEDFQGISVSGAKYSELFVTYLKTANAPSGRITGGTTAVYSGLPPLIASFSSRGPDVYFGLDQTSATDELVADVLEPNLVAPSVDIYMWEYKISGLRQQLIEKALEVVMLRKKVDTLTLNSQEPSHFELQGEEQLGSILVIVPSQILVPDPEKCKF